MKKGIKTVKDMKMISEINGQLYEAEDCCFFRNPTQSAFYKCWGCELVDHFVDGKMKWVWVFWKKDHAWAKHRWIENKENSENKDEDNG